MNLQSILTGILLALAISFNAYSQNTLQSKIERIIDGKNIKLGFAAENLQTGEKISIDGETLFPMEGVSKLPIAVEALKAIEVGRFEMNEAVPISSKEYLPHIESPLAERYPDGTILPLSDLISYLVSMNDDNAAYFISTKMAGKEKTALPNTITPDAMIQYLKRLAGGELLREDGQMFLWGTLVNSAMGSVTRMLPGDIEVARITGGSQLDMKAQTASVNEVGLMELHNGDLIAFAIFTTELPEYVNEGYNIIAEIGLAMYRYFTK